MFAIVLMKLRYVLVNIFKFKWMGLTSAMSRRSRYFIGLTPLVILMISICWTTLLERLVGIYLLILSVNRSTGVLANIVNGSSVPGATKLTQISPMYIYMVSDLMIVYLYPVILYKHRYFFCTSLRSANRMASWCQFPQIVDPWAQTTGRWKWVMNCFEWLDFWVDLVSNYYLVANICHYVMCKK